MLGDHPVDVMLLATDLEVAKRFYNDRIGLEVVLESDDFVTFACGGDSRLVVTRSTTGSTEDTPGHRGGSMISPPRRPSCARAGSHSSRYRVSRWSTASPTSASRLRPGSSIPIATRSASPHLKNSDR